MFSSVEHENSFIILGSGFTHSHCHCIKGTVELNLVSDLNVSRLLTKL